MRLICSMSGYCGGCVDGSLGSYAFSCLTLSLQSFDSVPTMGHLRFQDLLVSDSLQVCCLILDHNRTHLMLDQVRCVSCDTNVGKGERGYLQIVPTDRSHHNRLIPHLSHPFGQGVVQRCPQTMIRNHRTPHKAYTRMSCTLYLPIFLIVIIPHVDR